MALTYVQRHILVNSAPFLGRIEVALVKYAVYLRNASTTGALGNWASAVLNDSAARGQWVARLKWYVVENVAAAGALTVGGDDSDATDAAIGGQVETQVQAQA